MAAPGKYALLIGNSDFSDPRLSRLLTPADDVKALKEVLLDPEIGEFEGDNIVEVLDESLEPVQRAVHWLFNGRTPDDLVLLYYSGHGQLTRNNRLYLALQGSSIDAITAGSFPARELKDAMDDSRSRKQIIILDCCHSGAFVEGVKAGTTKAVNKRTFDPEGYGRYILTASDSMQFAWDGQKLADGDEGATEKTSPFTQFLTQGLKTGEAAPKSETISVDQLYSYVHKKIVEADGINMTPQRFVDKGAGALTIARNPHRRARVHEDLLANLVSESHHARIGAVHGLWMLVRGNDPAMAAAARQELEARLSDGEYDVRVREVIEHVLDPERVEADAEAERQRKEKQRKATAERRRKARERKEAQRREEEAQEAEAERRRQEAEKEAEAEAERQRIEAQRRKKEAQEAGAERRRQETEKKAEAEAERHRKAAETKQKQEKALQDVAASWQRNRDTRKAEAVRSKNSQPEIKNRTLGSALQGEALDGPKDTRTNTPLQIGFDTLKNSRTKTLSSRDRSSIIAFIGTIFFILFVELIN